MFYSIILFFWVLLYWIFCVHCLPGMHYTFFGDQSPILLCLFKDLLLPISQTMTFSNQTKRLWANRTQWHFCWEQRQLERIMGLELLQLHSHHLKPGNSTITPILVQPFTIRLLFSFQGRILHSTISVKPEKKLSVMPGVV